MLVDMAAYFKAAKAALSKARRSIYVLGWAFDPDTYFEPGEDGGGPSRDRIGAYLRHLACARPEVDVRVLIWKSSLPIAASQNFFPHRAKKAFKNSPVKFLLDAAVPFGACHHQKMIVIDDELAFCGGGDIAPDRWDTPEHLDDNPHRRSRTGRRFEARHEVMTLLDGPCAEALGDLFRARWTKATQQTVAPPQPAGDGIDLWPDCASVDFRDVTIGIARTEPKWRGFPEVREAERLHLAAIAGARRTIYMENQYFASPIIAEALAARLAEPDGPEVVLVSTQHSPSWFDQMSMDRTRLAFIKRLTAADQEGRPGGGKFHAYCPVTEKGRSIIVHAKLTIIDDQMLRIGSANINNRSTGFDTECDLALEAQDGEAGAAVRQAVDRIRTRLIAHWLDVKESAFVAALDRCGGLAAAIDSLDEPGTRRLRPLRPAPIGPIATFIATYHLGDPAGPYDSWAPWRRRRVLAEQLKRLSGELARSGLPAPADELRPETV